MKSFLSRKNNGSSKSRIRCRKPASMAVAIMLLSPLVWNLSTAQVQESDDGSATCVGVCCQLFKSGDTESGDMDMWLSGIGAFGGDMQMLPNGPDGNGFGSFEYSDRLGIHDGPSQDIDPECFAAGETYKISGFYQLADQDSIPYNCSSAAWKDPLVCPFFSIRYIQRDTLQWKWFNMNNQINKKNGDGVINQFTHYASTFQAPDDLSTALDAYFVIRGPPKESAIIFGQMSLVPYNHNPGKVEENPLPVCYGICCEMVTAGSPNLGNKGLRDPIWDPSADISVQSRNNILFYRHDRRTDYKSGPNQYIHPMCLEEGKGYKFTAQVRVTMENGEPFACNPNKFTNPESCPVAGIRYKTADGKWEFVSIPSHIIADRWSADKFMRYHAVFRPPEILQYVIEYRIVFVGPPKGYNIDFESVSLVPYKHNPDIY